MIKDMPDGIRGNHCHKEDRESQERGFCVHLRHPYDVILTGFTEEEANTMVDLLVGRRQPMFQIACQILKFVPWGMKGGIDENSVAQKGDADSPKVASDDPSGV